MGQYINRKAFSRTELADALRIWEHAAVSLIDIRHNLISPESPVLDYHLPASAFVYTSQARAEVILDGSSFSVERFGLFHGGKGAELSIRPAGDWLEYYMLLYKPGEPPFHKREFRRLLERTNPFRQQYGFAPSNPLLFGHQLRLMYEKWRAPTPLNLFYGKAAFYPLVYEVYEELDKGQIHAFEPDIISMARRHFDRHFSEAITVQEVCNMLGISYSHFHRRFTKQVGKSPQDYLIQARLSAAIDFLNAGEASIREIAEHCGFQDERNFHRLFVKNRGVSPAQYRKNVSDCRRDYTLENISPFSYNEESQVSLDEPKGKGATFMFKQMRSKAVVAAALSLMLLMSACGTGTALAASNGENSAPTSAVIGQVSQAGGTAPAEEGTRTISTVTGEVEVPINPQNVLVNYLIGDVLAFGIAPVAVDKSEGTAFYEQIKNLPELPSWNEPEALMTFDPELIILPSQYYYESLSPLAPVIVCPADFTERITLLGQVFGMEEKAAEILQNNTQKAKVAKEKLEEAGLTGKTFSIVQDNGDGGATVNLYYNDNGRGGDAVYQALGLSAPTKFVEEYAGFSMTVSMEVASEYLGDYIFYIKNESSDNFGNSAVWNSIPAVRDGKLIVLDHNLFIWKDILSTNAQIDVITEELLQLANR